VNFLLVAERESKRAFGGKNDPGILPFARKNRSLTGQSEASFFKHFPRFFDGGGSTAREDRRQ